MQRIRNHQDNLKKENRMLIPPYINTQFLTELRQWDITSMINKSMKINTSLKANPRNPGVYMQNGVQLTVKKDEEALYELILLISKIY